MNKRIILSLALALLLLLGVSILLLSCGGDYVKPEKITLYLYSEDESDVIVLNYELQGRYYYSLDSQGKTIDRLHTAHQRTGFVLMGYASEKQGSTYYPSSSIKFYNGNGSASSDNYILRLANTKKGAPKSQEISLYAWWKPIEYSVTYDCSEADFWSWYSIDPHSHSTLDTTRFDGATVYKSPIAPALTKVGYDFLGWRTISDGTFVFDSHGEPLFDEVGMFERLSSGVAVEPVFDLPRITVNFKYGKSGIDDITQAVYKGSDASLIEYPRSFLYSGYYLKGWSLSKDEIVLPEGKLDSDVTLYAHWLAAKPLQVVLPGYTDPTVFYVLQNGEIIGDMPKELDTYEIDQWYTDEGRENRKNMNYLSATANELLYVSCRKVKKLVTLYPKNGDTAYAVYICKNPDNNDFSLPTWAGYEIEGWYRSEDLSGEAVTLDFGSVNDGESYYAKWIKVN